MTTWTVITLDHGNHHITADDWEMDYENNEIDFTVDGQRIIANFNRAAVVAIIEETRSPSEPVGDPSAAGGV